MYQGDPKRKRLIRGICDIVASARTVARGGGHLTEGFVGEDGAGLILTCESGGNCLVEGNRARAVLARERPVMLLKFRGNRK